MVWYGSNPDGQDSFGAPEAAEFSWVLDDNGTKWFVVLDEQTGDLTYYDQPNGTAGTPVAPVGPVTSGGGGGGSGAPFSQEGFWVADVNTALWFLVINEQTGVATYYDQPNGTAGTPTFPVAPASTVDNIPLEDIVIEFLDKTNAGIVPEKFDEIEVDYVPFGGDPASPAEGEIEKITWSLSGNVVAIVEIDFDNDGNPIKISRQSLDP